MSDKKETTKEKADRYVEAVGRRKTSVARVRIFSKSKPEFLVNDKQVNVYFLTAELRNIIEDPIKKMKASEDKLKITVKISGGGIHSQAEALRHGISRALIKMNPDFRKRLKKAGFLTRDARMKERRKFGLKKARKAPQWSKR